MAECYAIKDWEQRFCVSQGKRVFRWSWVALPINPNGEHYRILMETPEGREAYCVFMGLLGVAANGEPRGVLADRSGPLSVRAIHYRIGIAEPVVSKAIQILSGPDIGWLVPVQLGARSETAPSTLGDGPPATGSKTARSTLGARSETHYPTQPNPTEHDKTKPNKGSGAIYSLPVGSGGSGKAWTAPSLTTALIESGINKATAQRLGSYASKFDGFDVIGEFRRLSDTPSVSSPTGALVKLMAQHAGIEMDQRKLAGALQDVVNQRRGSR